MKIQKYKFINADTEQVWKKELKLVLNRDIHEKGLGCCIDNTHMKIGDIHIGKFFEAQFLFGNAYWISIFSNALKEIIVENNKNYTNRILIIGYETYIEPVAIQTRDLLYNSGYNVEYCIYEEPKYIAHGKKSGVRIRFRNDKDLQNYDSYIIICGIASTLSTYNQIISKIQSEIHPDIINISDENEKNDELIKTRDDLIKKSSFYSIIQVLPSEFENKCESKFYLNEDDYLINLALDHTVSRDFLSIKTKYLVSVFCEWQNARSCKWCYDKNMERPIVATNETSIIPVQMIGNRRELNIKSTAQTVKIDFFERDKDKNFIYLDYLYYNHIERSNHHYQYYIRTNSLIKKITETKNDIIDVFCKNVREKLITDKTENRIDVLVVPAHYSNEQFFNIISKRVFNSCCEIISFNPKKEFRSNFETKYSNYAYIFDALQKNNDTKVYFHYVDDQLITGTSYYRAKSFVKSLFNNSNFKSAIDVSKKISLFESVIVLLNRNSASSKLNYIDDSDKFFSLIDITVPFLRNYGDSCYLCAKTQNANEIKKKSAYISMSDYWLEKESYHSIKNLEEAKIAKSKQKLEIIQRKFRNFYCENLLWSNLKNNWSDADTIYKNILNIMASDIKYYDRRMQYEYIMSFIKILSRPFLYYRENIKKAVLAILLYMIHVLNTDSDVMPSSILLILKKIEHIDHKHAYDYIDNYEITERMRAKKENKEKYYLYVILLSNLSSINSNYLINSENIKYALSFYNKIKDRLQDIKENNDDNIDEISKYICRYIKNITNGISGNYKALKLDEELADKELNDSNSELVQRLYLENLEAVNRKSDFFDKNSFSKENDSLKERYSFLLKKIVPDNDAYLIVSISEKSLYILAKNHKKYNEDLEHELRNKFIKNQEEEVIIEKNYFAIKCCKSLLKDVGCVYLVVSDYKNVKNIFNQYAFIRSILCYRYDLCVLLEEDIKSGSIKALFDDESWMETLSQPKAVSHGQSEDIREHLFVLDQLYFLYSAQINDSKYNVKGYNIYSEITLFSNLLISHYHFKRISNDNGRDYKFKDELRIVHLDYYQSIHSEEDSYGKYREVDDSDFDCEPNITIQEELKNKITCIQAFLPRFRYYLNCMSEHGYSVECDTSVIETDNSITKIINLYLTNSSSIWFSIAIIHMLIRNAIQHGAKNSSIRVLFEKNGSAYNLIVQNFLNNNDWKTEQGITQKALTAAFEGSYAEIEFNAFQEQGSYVAKITNFFIGEDRNEIYYCC